MKAQKILPRKGKILYNIAALGIVRGYTNPPKGRDLYFFVEL